MTDKLIVNVWRIHNVVVAQIAEQPRWVYGGGSRVVATVNGFSFKVYIEPQLTISEGLYGRGSDTTKDDRCVCCACSSEDIANVLVRNIKNVVAEINEDHAKLIESKANSPVAIVEFTRVE